MARSKEHGNGRLEEAMAQLAQDMSELKQSNVTLKQAQENLVQAQALLVRNQAAFEAQKTQDDRETVELKRQSDQRFARIEAILLEHSRFLADHTRILEALPDAIRDKIGFRMAEKS